jgi:hypothetical protein
MAREQAQLVSTSLQLVITGLTAISVMAGIGGQLMKISKLPHWEPVLLVGSGALVVLAVAGLLAGIQIAHRRSRGAFDAGDRVVPPALVQYLFLTASVAVLGGVAGQTLSILSAPGAERLLQFSVITGIAFLVLGLVTAGFAVYRFLA